MESSFPIVLSVDHICNWDFRWIVRKSASTAIVRVNFKKDLLFAQWKAILHII